MDFSGSLALVNRNVPFFFPRSKRQAIRQRESTRVEEKTPFRSQPMRTACGGKAGSSPANRNARCKSTGMTAIPTPGRRLDAAILAKSARTDTVHFAFLVSHKTPTAQLVVPAGRRKSSNCNLSLTGRAEGWLRPIRAVVSLLSGSQGPSYIPSFSRRCRSTSESG